MTKNLLNQSLTWIFPKEDPAWHESIVKEFCIHPVTAQLLVSRGFSTFEDIHDLLYAKLPNLLAPSLFVEMKAAVDRIHKALQDKENILIYGDNDVDGITGTTLLVDFFTQLNANTFYYIPNRTSSKQNSVLDALEYAKKNQCSLLITVDCGITAAKEIEHLVKENIDVIVTDHHEPTDRIPHCVATLNPKLISNNYPNHELTGVGVAFKLAHALTNMLVSSGEISTKNIDLKRFLDLVALGTIADMGTLQGENRILARYGLKQFGKTKRIGLLKLLEVCELNPSKITTADVASKIAPRLNSLGRIANPRKGVELLLLKDPIKAENLAIELDLNNIERQKIERKDSDEIEEFIENNKALLQEKAIVLFSDKWHPGTIPIIAARIAKQYNRPTTVIAIEDGIGKGSLRTIPEFPLLNILKDSRDLLLNFGGHDYAAGLSIKEENIPEFKELFIAAANKELASLDVLPKLQLDAKVSFKDLTFDFLESLSLIEPFGMGNPAPILYTTVKQSWSPKVVGGKHLKLYLEQDERILEGIAFNFAEMRPLLLKKDLFLEIAFTPQVNIFLNKSSIQLQIKDIKIKE